MPLYNLKSRIREQFLLGTMITINSPDIVETLGQSGVDFLCLDAEHAPFGIADLGNLIRTADLVGIPLIVRVPEPGFMIGAVLDLGAAGVIVPRLETVEQARAVVDQARYPPSGKRGAGATRCAMYGHSLAEHIVQANEEILVLVQIETAPGLLVVDRIAAVPGIDGLMIGPFDLSVSLNVQIGTEPHDKAMGDIVAAARAHGIAAATFCISGGQAAQADNDGMNLAVMNMDRLLLQQASRDAVSEYRRSSHK